jgi:hypothetical protein
VEIKQALILIILLSRAHNVVAREDKQLMPAEVEIKRALNLIILRSRAHSVEAQKDKQPMLVQAGGGILMVEAIQMAGVVVYPDNGNRMIRTVCLLAEISANGQTDCGMWKRCFQNVNYVMKLQGLGGVPVPFVPSLYDTVKNHNGTLFRNKLQIL